MGKIKTTQRDRETIETLRNLSGETIGRVNNILKSLMVYTVLNSSENETVTIPHLGTFKISYKDDKIVNGDLKCEVDSLYIPSEELKLNIGKLHDVLECGGDLTSIPIINSLKLESKRQLSFELDT